MLYKQFYNDYLQNAIGFFISLINYNIKKMFISTMIVFIQ